MPVTPAVRRVRLRATFAVLVAALLLTGLTGPAQAERYIHRDASGDVQKVRLFTQKGDDFVRAPHARQGDYVKVKIWHQVRAVRVVGKFRRLDRTGTGLSQVVVIRTPGDMHFFQVTAGPGMWKGIEMSDTDDLDEEGGFSGDSPCIVGHHVNYERDRFAMRISRACLGRPAWVRVATAFIATTRRTVTVDEPLGRDFAKRLPFSPRLVHGDPR